MDYNKIYGKEFDSLLDIIVQSITEERVLSGEEKAILDRWLNENEKNRETYDSIKKGENIKELLDLIESDFSNRQLRAVMHRINRKEMRRKVLRFSAYASSAAILILTLFIWFKSDEKVYRLADSNKGSTESVYMITDGNKKISLEGEVADFNELKDRDDKAAVKNEADSNNTVVVPKGREFNIVLPDGTMVWLGANTSLSFPSKFKESCREVYLEGEAYFDVTKNKKKPFFVKTKNIVTEVFGTEFIVNSFKGSQYCSVALLSGSVKVANNRGDNVILNPGQKAVSIDDNNDFSIETVNVENLKMTREGMFVFWGNKIKDIIPILNNWYDYQITCDERVGNMVFYIKVNKNSPLKEVIEMLSKTNIVNYSIDDENKLIKLTSK